MKRIAKSQFFKIVERNEVVSWICCYLHEQYLNSNNVARNSENVFATSEFGRMNICNKTAHYSHY
jgi:hypothetical protein